VDLESQVAQIDESNDVSDLERPAALDESKRIVQVSGGGLETKPVSRRIPFRPNAITLEAADNQGGPSS
jgi:hypothetical protein